MAGGKLSPRQKMINMMYLVLTALLALNISKDILHALTKLNESLDKSVQTINTKNADIYTAFEQAMTENPTRTKPWRDKALAVKKESDALYTYIGDLKHNLIEISGGYEEGYEKGSDRAKSLDAREKPANYLLNEDHAKELKTKIEAYRSAVANGASDNLKKNIASTFNTDAQEVGEDKVKVDWEHANFEHFPLAAILPFLTDIQAKVRNTESELITQFRQNIDASTMKFSGIRAVVVPKSTYVTQGGTYEADVFVAAYDDTQEPVITINGENLPADQIAGGVGKLKLPANQLGEQKWAGVITIKQMGKDDTEIPVDGVYRVAPPTAVISPTKMNVLYRGVDNPLDIAVPGADPAKVRVSGAGVSGSNGNYMANVTKLKGKEITINVSVDETDEEGNTKSVSYGSKKFRIKGLPLASGLVYKQSNSTRSVNLIKNLTVEAEFEDFPFDLPLTVTAFEVAIPGYPPERIKGNRLTSAAKTKIGKLKPGSTITIRKIVARGPKNLEVRKIGNVSIDVN